jgi:hypothetical protein
VAVRRVRTSLAIARVGTACTAAFLAVGCSSGSAAPPRVTDVTALPATYQIVYRVTTTSGSTSQQAWEVLTQTDPFDASDLTYAADPRSGAEPQTGTVSSFDELFDLANGRLRLVSDRQPGPGSGVGATGVELAELAHHGLARPVGQSVFAGNGCDVARFGEPPVGPITPPNGSGSDDVCIDRSGLEVHDAWTYHGRLVLEREAEEIRIGSPDPSIAGPPSLSSAEASSAPSVLKVSQPAGKSYLDTPPSPAGFTARPAVSTAAFNPSDPSQVTDVSTIWSFSDAGAVVTVEAGQGQLPWDPAGSPTESLELKGLGQAAVAFRSDGPEIRSQLGQDRWVRVRGTVPPGELSRYASELRLAGG